MAQDERIVLFDASAVLAVVFREPGVERVMAHLAQGFAPTPVMVEILSKMAQKGGTVSQARLAIEGFGLKWRALGPAVAELAADYLLRFRRNGISLADATCLAMAEMHNLPVLTGDRQWAMLGLKLDIRLIR
jgi:PIN domain nuclease of toxin-antitoxin system